jgi:prepilin-type N-terminal cleavage/methylation domain-containing protein/prepilin-type processing-associated H-X9-DG protein
MTLIEVLVVIAIIAILAGILFPVFASVKEKGRTAVCQSNLHQIGVAFQLYLQDYDDIYPCTGDYQLWMGRWWRWPLKPYLALAATEGNAQHPDDPTYSSGSSTQSILACPSDPEAAADYDCTSYAYSMSFYLSPAQINAMTSPVGEYTYTGLQCIPQSESSVAYPSMKALLGEWTSNHTSPYVGWWGNYQSGGWGQYAWEGARNYVFADGHCKYLRAGQLNSANDGFPDINLTCDGIQGKDVD